MPDACGIVRSRYRARTGAGYVLVFSNKPGGLLGVLTALMGLMSRGLWHQLESSISESASPG